VASTIRTLVLNVATLSVPVALKTASEKKLPSFSTASPKGNRFEKFVGTGIEEESVVETPEDAKAVAEELGVPVEEVQNGKRTRYRDTVTGEVFEEHEIKHGVWEGDTFYAIDKHEIEKINALTKLDELTIQGFVPLDDVPWERVKNGYYLTPNKGAGLKALNLLRVALEQTGTAGVALLCPKSRVHLALIYARHGGVIVSTLAFAEEWAQVREGAASLSDPRGEPTEKEVEMAVKLVEALSTDAAVLDGVGDLQANMKADLVEKAKMGQPLTEVDADVRKVGGGVTERDETLLERMLRESLQAAKATKKSGRKHKTPKKASRATTRKRAVATK
jgi:DNA end-binding protein Ku